ncbi:MAG: glycosyltransferase family 4 protein [Verrucomicrobia bacterium]|nr:glycosyltransferase family 4 protein [Verrucomicrobiota bacterium]
MKRILFLTQGDIEIASSRHRVFQYLPVLEKSGIEAVVHPAVTTEESREAFAARSWQTGVRRLFRTFTRRVRDLHQLRDFDYIFVQKPILPGPFFNMELRISREAKMIFDFDDAIFMKKRGGMPIANIWPQSGRVAGICRRAHRVVVGNEFLAKFVRKAKAAPVVLPTAVDTEAFAAGSNFEKRAQKIPVLGWVGSRSTQSDLKLLFPPLIQLHSRTPFVVRIIGGSQEPVPLRFPIEWKPWSLQTEINDIAHLDYGLAPMEDNAWNRGKCGLKILQYWAAGVPVIASSMGIYKEIIRDGENGMLAATETEWTEKLLALIKNRDLRQKIIDGGHKTVEEKFSLRALTPHFLSLFEEPLTPSP